MHSLRALVQLTFRGLRRVFRTPYLGRHDRLTKAGKRALFETQIRSGF